MSKRSIFKTWEIREWAFLFLGSAIGAGILFVPLQAAKVSIFATFLSIIVALIGAYCGHKLMIKMTATTPNCGSYDDAIEYHLGKTAGIILSTIFIIFLFSIIVVLGTGLNDNLAAMISFYDLTELNLSKYPLFIFILLALLATPLIIGERFLLAMIEKVVVVKVVILAILVLMFIPLWKMENIHHYLDFSLNGLGRGIFILLPVLIFGATFFPSIGSMSRYFQKVYPALDKTTLFKETNKTNAAAILMLAVVLIAFITSTLFALTPSSLSYAGEHNLSALAVIGKVASKGFFSSFCIFAGFLVTVLALMTSYYAVILGVIDGVVSRIPGVKHIPRKLVIIVIHLILWLWIYFDINILVFIEHVISPLIVIFVFLIPVIAVYSSKKIGSYKTKAAIICLIIGIFLLIASFTSW